MIIFNEILNQKTKMHNYRGNKKRYIFPLNIHAWRQGMLVVCKKKESNS